MQGEEHGTQICKVKEFRKVATRYDKFAKVSLAFLHVTAVLLWIR